MPKLTIYVPDALAEALREADDLNVSAVCQRALEEEVRRMTASEDDRPELESLLGRMRSDLERLNKNMPQLEELARLIPRLPDMAAMTKGLPKAADVMKGFSAADMARAQRAAETLMRPKRPRRGGERDA